MSRMRTRPTREETRAKLFQAAAEIFERHGIGDTSVDAIAAQAGFTRGAFYSNFDTKDDLILAMLEDHGERSLLLHRALLKEHREPQDLIAALKSLKRHGDPLGHSPLLHIELILYVARAEKRRPDLAKRLRARRKLVAEVVATAVRRPRLDPDSLGALLVALEDGYRLHRLIDPATTPAVGFFDAVSELQRLIQPSAKAAL
jgi:AcrR family transcriptional regulator